jgi:hypothetical protein
MSKRKLGSALLCLPYASLRGYKVYSGYTLLPLYYHQARKKYTLEYTLRRKSGIRHYSSAQKPRPHSCLIPSCFPPFSFFLMAGFLCPAPTDRSVASPNAVPCLARLLARQPPADRSGTGGRSPFRDFSRPGLPHTRNGFARENPPARGGRLFHWGQSSNAPKPLWIVYVPDASRTDPPTTHAYIQPENVRSFQISKMYICATNDLANLSVENAFWRLAR